MTSYTLRETLTRLMADGEPRTISQLARLANTREDAVKSSLRGMRNRKEAVELKPKAKDQPYTYRLRSHP